MVMEEDQEQRSQKVFVYGTLMTNEVLSTLLGVLPIKDVAVLYGYRRLCVADRVYPGIVEDPDSLIVGQILHVSPSQLSLLNYFEDDDYSLTQVTVTLTYDEVVTSALCYVWKDEFRHLLQDKEWDQQIFLRDHLPSYLKMCTEVRCQYTWQHEHRLEFEENKIRAIAKELPVMSTSTARAGRVRGLPPTIVFQDDS